MWDKAKPMIRGKFIKMHRKEEKSQINNLTFHLRNQKKNKIIKAKKQGEGKNKYEKSMKFKIKKSTKQGAGSSKRSIKLISL